MSKCQEIKDVERKIRNLINFLSEGEGKKFPSIKKELENLENKKKVLEFDLEGTRLSIQKEGQVKFEAKIVLNTLKDFAEKIDQIEPADRPHLFQYLIKSISYGKDEIVVEIFYLPPERVRVGGVNSFLLLYFQTSNAVCESCLTGGANYLSLPPSNLVRIKK